MRLYDNLETCNFEKKSSEVGENANVTHLLAKPLFGIDSVTYNTILKSCTRLFISQQHFIRLPWNNYLVIF